MSESQVVAAQRRLANVDELVKESQRIARSVGISTASVYEILSHGVPTFIALEKSLFEKKFSQAEVLAIVECHYRISLEDFQLRRLFRSLIPDYRERMKVRRQQRRAAKLS